MLHAVTTSDSKLYWIVISNYEMASSSGTVAENSTQNANSEGSNPIAGIGKENSHFFLKVEMY
jgi:hypothetical protein